MRSHRTIIASFFLLLAAVALNGCAAGYVAPGRAANMTVFLDPDIQEAYKRKPMSPMPASIAVVRVQESGYQSHTAQAYGRGSYSVITVRDVEGEDAAERIAQLPDVAGVAAVNRLVLGQSLKTDQELRVAAASLGADMLLIYTFDTTYRVADNMRPLTVISFGLMPTKVAHVSTTASALLMDVRTGHIYASAESTSRQNPPANAWTSEDAVDNSRQSTERKAFDKLVTDFERIWPRIATQRKQALAAGR